MSRFFFFSSRRSSFLYSTTRASALCERSLFRPRNKKRHLIRHTPPRSSFLASDRHTQSNIIVDKNLRTLRTPSEQCSVFRRDASLRRRHSHLSQQQLLQRACIIERNRVLYPPHFLPAFCATIQAETTSIFHTTSSGEGQHHATNKIVLGAGC